MFIFFLVGISSACVRLIPSKSPLLLKEKSSFWPAHTQHLYDNVYLDKTEVANLDYLEFLFYISKDSSIEDCLKYIPHAGATGDMDNLMDPKGVRWSASYRYIELGIPTLHGLYSIYLQYPGFRYYPVVGISHSQAQAFCRWKSEAYTQLHRSDTLWVGQGNRRRGYTLKYEFRLPTEEEWELAASFSLPPTQQFVHDNRQRRKDRYKVIQDSMVVRLLEEQEIPFTEDTYLFSPPAQVKGGAWLSNGEYLDIENSPYQPPFEQEGIPTNVYSHPPSDMGVFQLYGNVAEMIARPGMAKGGSYLHSAKDLSPTFQLPYSQPTHWLGFRTVCEVHLTPVRFE